MHCQSHDHLPVVLGRLIIGIVTGASLTAIAPVELASFDLARGPQADEAITGAAASNAASGGAH